MRDFVLIKSFKALEDHLEEFVTMDQIIESQKSISDLIEKCRDTLDTFGYEHAE
jgi:hypothetical protein